MNRRPRPLTMPALVAVAALALAGCAGDFNPTRDILAGVGVGPQPRATPEFVEETRAPGRPDYVPIGLTPPERELVPKTSAEVAEAEAELRRLVEANAERAEAARRLSLSPAPEPVRVEPLPAFERDLAPPSPN